MGLYHFFTKLNINEGVKAFQKNANAFLIDVRTREEYAEGHIVGSKNVPLQSIAEIAKITSDKNALLYVYCRSGARSAKAVEILKNMGYANAIDIGGILAYHGEIVRG